MGRHFASTAVLSVAISVGLSAQRSIDGTWTGQVDADGGASQTIHFVLKTDVDKVTGSIVGGGSEMAVQDGTLSGNSLEFKATQRGENGSSLGLSCTGAVNDDTITITCRADGQPDKTFDITRQSDR